MEQYYGWNIGKRRAAEVRLLGLPPTAEDRTAQSRVTRLFSCVEKRGGAYSALVAHCRSVRGFILPVPGIFERLALLYQ